jgi:hypothetical protein
VVVLKETFPILGPDNDTAICTTCCKLLTVLLICYAIDGVSMATDLLDHLSSLCVIDEYSICDRQEHLLAIFFVK